MSKILWSLGHWITHYQNIRLHTAHWPWYIPLNVKHNVLEAGFDSASVNSSILKPMLFDQQYSVNISHLIQRNQQIFVYIITFPWWLKHIHLPHTHTHTPITKPYHTLNPLNVLIFLSTLANLSAVRESSTKKDESAPRTSYCKQKWNKIM